MSELTKIIIGSMVAGPIEDLARKMYVAAQKSGDNHHLLWGVSTKVSELAHRVGGRDPVKILREDR